ncbi:MAG: MBL fold metallo-hydrolase [Rectinemataceae bacterium]|nr:MBL fold metallo-hydrolase [Rectinemataceae bacterium]
MSVRIEKLQVGFIGGNTYAIAVDADRVHAVSGGHAGNSVCILVDPGDESEKIVAWLDGLGLIPTLIVATHGHLDHTAAIPGVRKAYLARLSGSEDGGRKSPEAGGASGTGARSAPGFIPFAVHRDDAAYFGNRSERTNRELFRAIHASAYFTHFWHPLPDPDLVLADGDTIPGTGFRVIHTPGHSAGSICLYDEGAGILVSGDTLFRDGVGRSDGPDSDPALLDSSLASLMLLPASTRVFPGHGDETTIERESRNFFPR